MRRVRQILLMLLALGTGACGTSAAPVPLFPAYDSKDAAVEAFLRGLAARDRTTLAGLAVSKNEFLKYIWPALPASRPDVGMPADRAWADQAQRNAAYLSETLAGHGGREYRLLAVTFAGGTTDYGAYQIHRETTLDVRGPNGPATVRLFGSLVESGGRWKIYSFVVD